MWWALHDITRRRVCADRIVLLSDLCCYTQGDVNCGVNLREDFGSRAMVQSMIDVYRQEVNDDVRVYSINLSGHGQSHLRPSGDRTHILSGWSEKVFDLMRELESGSATEQSVPASADDRGSAAAATDDEDQTGKVQGWVTSPV